MFWFDTGNKSAAGDCYQTALSQSAMTECVSENAKKGDAALDAIYEKLITKISPEGQTTLKAAKEAWIEYREKQCAFNSLGSKIGSTHSTILSQCYVELTHHYSKLLQAQLDCEEGNVSCGGQ